MQMMKQNSNKGVEWIILLLILACLCYKSQSNSQVTALCDMKAKLNDTENQLYNWYPNQINPCTFTFVICEPMSNNVSELTLTSMGFKGTLSPLIGNLQSLTVLSLMGNKITGEIPKEFGNLSKLTSLNLENNLLTGEIPASLGSLSVLQTLDLSGNNLRGSIPDSLSNISSLNNIGLAFNHLTGKIPDSLFNVATFNFTNNSLNCGENIPCTSYIPAQGGSHKPKLEIVLGSIAGAIALLALLITFILCNSRKNKAFNRDIFQDVPGENDLKITLGQIKRFTFRELQSATEDFSDKNFIGKGAFANVYKGIIFDGEKGKPIKIAVKRLINMQKGGEDFLREIELISVAAHKNLLRLIGFCVTSNERLLVYPFMENLSLAYRLRDLKEGEAALDWSTRKQIALGTAQALEYLHEQCDPKIIHRDVKAANVLLDTDLKAVVGDFGFAKLVDPKKTSVTTHVHGTMGHIAPEYLSTGRSSVKTDVFSYGIMLLELITGQHSICLNGGRDDDILLIDHVIKLHREERTGAIVDPKLDGAYHIDGVERMIQVALLCAQPLPDERPAMSAVVKMLEGEGLDERWEHFQQMEVTGESSYENMVRFKRGNNNLDVYECESLYVAEAIELSGGR
ncbi:hypothetical protein LUZ60_001189 [Juncus effusus]|nr:hypothetical protein LUZ60_001189 [Juncus effusus]